MRRCFFGSCGHSTGVWLRGCLSAGLAFVPPNFAYAASTKTTSFTVSATVLASCSVSATNLSFGNYTASSGTNLDATSTVSVTCTNGQAYTIALDGGSVAADVSARTMSDGAAHTLAYSLYTDAGRTTLWGDGTSGTSTVAGTGDGTQQDATVYGRIAASQFAAAGSYTDTVTVTVSY